MARKVLDYFEPWLPRKSTSWEGGFRFRPVCDDREVLDKWDAARDRAEKNAEWDLWGDRLWTPSATLSLLGEASVDDGRGIVATFRPYHTERQGTPDHGQLARRAAECVNACAGIVNPTDAIERARSLLFDLAQGRADASDPRVVSCLARLLKVVPETQQPGCWEE
jgi:hypothetical protein